MKQPEWLSEEQFALQDAALGHSVHKSGGRWWKTAAPMYCKPVHEYRPIGPGEAKPSLFKALGGFTHQVSDPSHSTRILRMNILSGSGLESFDLQHIAGNGWRTSLRKALKSVEIRSIACDDGLLERMRQINISHAQRFQDVGRSNSYRKPSYYQENSAEWFRQMRALLAHRGHNFIGAFSDDTLVAYLDLITIEDTWMIGAVKSDWEFANKRPVDVLYFHALSMASENGACRRVVNGGGDEPEGLRRFKEDFLFRSVDVHYFTRTILPFKTLMKFRRRH